MSVKIELNGSGENFGGATARDQAPYGPIRESKFESSVRAQLGWKIGRPTHRGFSAWTA
jgi:hypothetical protein